MIIPARERTEAQHTLDNIHPRQTLVAKTVVITLPTAGAQSSVQPEITERPVIDREAFTINVLQQPTTTNGSGT